MTVRETLKIRDIQDCIVEVLKKYAEAAPWSSWTIKFGFPDIQTTGDFGPYVYVMAPMIAGQVEMMGAGKPLNFWTIVVGFWIVRASGGADEIQVWCSEMISKFQDIKAIHEKQFTVTLGTTTYTNTTLLSQGVHVRSITGPSFDMAEDKDEFRQEFTITLIA